MTNVNLQALANDICLTAISVTALSACRIEREAESVDELSVDPQYTLHTRWGDDDKALRIILETKIDSSIGIIRCDVQADYILQALVRTQISQEGLQEFVNNVAVMSILPFVRQGIADITLRVFESPLLMPLIQRGEIIFNLPPATADVEIEG